MGKKLILLFIASLLLIPVIAGEVEKALEKDKPVFLYLYSDDCKYCWQFNPIYESLKNVYGSKYTFLKINSDTRYGRNLMRAYEGRYVPYVVLESSKKKQALTVPPGCMMNNSCINQALSKFYEYTK